MLQTFIQILTPIVYIFNILFALLVVFIEKKNPGKTWAWIFVIFVVPYFGSVIYLLLGLDGRKYAAFATKTRMDEKNYKDIIAANFEGLAFMNEQNSQLDVKAYLRIEGSDSINDLVYMNHTVADATLTRNNKLSLYHEGNEKFEAMLDDIAKAKKFIHLLYYIYRGDNLGKTLVAALAEKARTGVEVKLLIDGTGNRLTPKRIFKPLIDAGGSVSYFLPPHFIRINFRNHRKLCVVDGYIGYIGGLNIGDEYLGKSKRFGYWRDTHIRILGDAVKSLELRFIADWNYCCKTIIAPIAPNGFYFPMMERGGDGVNVQIVSSGPDTKWDGIYFGYSKMINEANKNIYIQTPYFVPDDNIFESLRIAALSGIDVRIIIPALPDHPFVYWASLSYLGELVTAGVRCYKYSKGFIHSKLMLIDGLVSSTGTANMDVRSFKLNFEINAFIYDRQTCKAFEEKFLFDLNDCIEITAEIYKNRSRFTKIRESISRLLSPLL